MLHPFITQSWCASGEPPWMPRPTTSESSGNSSSELIRIPGAAGSPQPRGWWHARSAAW
jgi:hypothetical protein